MQQRWNKGDKPLKEKKEGFIDPVICQMPSEGATQEPSQCLPWSHTGSCTEEVSVLGGWALENRGQKETMAAKELFLHPLECGGSFGISHLAMPLGKWLQLSEPWPPCLSKWVCTWTWQFRPNIQTWIFWQHLTCGGCSGNVVSFPLKNQSHGTEFSSLLRDIPPTFACNSFPLEETHPERKNLKSVHLKHHLHIP